MYRTLRAISLLAALAASVNCSSERSLPKASEDVDANAGGSGGGSGGTSGSGGSGLTDAGTGPGSDDASAPVIDLCPKDERRCSNGAIEDCRDNAWTEVMSCGGFCLNKACVTCKPDAKKCDGRTPQVCDATGSWKSAGTACDTGCNADTGLCNGCPTAGQKTCTGKDVFVCSAEKKWVKDSTCSANQGCIAGACTPCDPGVSATKCETDKVLECGVDGQWKEKTSCNKGCVTGTTTCRICTPDTEKRCAANGSAVEKCNANGTGWLADATCSAPANATDQCTNAACAGFKCNDGFTKCGAGTCRTECPGIMGLGDLTGGDFSSQATAIDSTGSTVVGSGTTANGFRPFKWTRSAGMIELPLLQNLNNGVAAATSSDGSVVVGYGEDSSALRSKALGWMPNVFTIASSSDGSSSYETVDVASNGQKFLVKEVRYEVGGTITFHTHVATAGMGLQEVFEGSPIGMSGDAKVIAASGPDGCTLTSVGTPPKLPDGSCFAATSVTRDGKYIYSSSGATPEVIRWKVGTQALERFTLPAEAGRTDYSSSSANGDVVVGRTYGKDSSFYFIWTSTSGLQSFAGYLATKGIALTGWDIIRPRVVSGDGKVVVGEAVNSNQKQEAFRVVLP